VNKVEELEAKLANEALSHELRMALIMEKLAQQKLREEQEAEAARAAAEQQENAQQLERLIARLESNTDPRLAPVCIALLALLGRGEFPAAREMAPALSLETIKHLDVDGIEFCAQLARALKTPNLRVNPKTSLSGHLLDEKDRARARSRMAALVQKTGRFGDVALEYAKTAIAIVNVSPREGFGTNQSEYQRALGFARAYAAVLMHTFVIINGFRCKGTLSETIDEFSEVNPAPRAGNEEWETQEALRKLVNRLTGQTGDQLVW
jgi:hypothetical protein